MSTTMQDTTTTHPDWCRTNHENDPDGGHTGPSWPVIPSMTTGSAGFDSVSIDTGTDDADRTVVWLEAAGLRLSPEQARQAGRSLIEAADWATAHAAATA